MRRTVLILTAVIVLGIAARALFLSLAPRYGFLGDHVDYVCWGRKADADGVLSLYDKGPGSCPAVFHAADGSSRLIVSGSGKGLNYPPLAAYVLWAQGQALTALDPAQTANTATARAVYALGTTVAEVVTALGTAALVRLFARPSAAAAAFALTFLAPPLLLNGPFWGQTEAWILAPGVWMVWAMARGRWLAAGSLWGLALGLKPSGLLFAPLWAYAFMFRRPRTRVVLGGVVAALVLNAVALPFWLTSGAAWLRSAYLENYVYDLHWTTMMAFNVWYVDLLLTERLDSRALLLGLPRDLWGTMLLVAGLAVAFAIARCWERRHPDRASLAVLPLATLVTLAALTLPTRVHSTYAAFTTPFLICSAFQVPWTTPGAAALIVAASLQILSWQWGNLLAVHVLPNELHAWPPERYAARRALRARDRPREWGLTLLSLTAAAAVFAAVAKDGRQPAGAQSEDAQDTDRKPP